ncbi:hypothetical protein BU15DRAFT_89689 [Melanogaster broomeanus]|nr:hypothetical protein BU15DRAFT_89689 [Melanogaster broomeanus]
MVYCERCERSFQSWSSYDQHVNDSSNHHVCDDCDEDFPTWLGLHQHYVQSPHHHYCQHCERHFQTYNCLIGHYRNEHSYCDTCDKVFKNDYGLHEHNRQYHHYCAQCKRVFQSANNLRAHMNSSVHRPKNVPCPFRGCELSFVSKSALILISSLNDRHNLITDPSKLLTAGDSVSEYFATERSWNGGAYECVLCHSEFRLLRDLNRHLASPRHQDKVYRCPLTSCHTTFRTLSALCQHVESERCGVLRFRAVKDAMDGLLNRVGSLTL